MHVDSEGHYCWFVARRDEILWPEGRDADLWIPKDDDINQMHKRKQFRWKSSTSKRIERREKIQTMSPIQQFLVEGSGKADESAKSGGSHDCGAKSQYSGTAERS